MGQPCWMTCHVIQHGHPIQKSLTFWKIFMILLNYSYFAKIMTGKPKSGNFTNMAKLYPFLESIKWYLLFRGFCGHVTSNEKHDTR